MATEPRFISADEPLTENQRSASDEEVEGKTILPCEDLADKSPSTDAEKVVDKLKSSSLNNPQTNLTSTPGSETTEMPTSGLSILSENDCGNVEPSPLPAEKDLSETASKKESRTNFIGLVDSNDDANKDAISGDLTRDDETPTLTAKEASDGILNTVPDQGDVDLGKIGADADVDFDPNAESQDFDDEQTLDEEEAMSRASSNDNELDDLAKQGDMPLEHLLAMYGYGNVSKDASPGRVNASFSPGKSPNLCGNGNSNSSSESEEILSNQDLTLDKDEIARDLCLVSRAPIAVDDLPEEITSLLEPPPSLEAEELPEKEASLSNNTSPARQQPPHRELRHRTRRNSSKDKKRKKTDTSSTAKSIKQSKVGSDAAPSEISSSTSETKNLNHLRSRTVLGSDGRFEDIEGRKKIAADESKEIGMEAEAETSTSSTPSGSEAHPFADTPPRRKDLFNLAAENPAKLEGISDSDGRDFSAAYSALQNSGGEWNQNSTSEWNHSATPTPYPIAITPAASLGPGSSRLKPLTTANQDQDSAVGHVGHATGIGPRRRSDDREDRLGIERLLRSAETDSESEDEEDYEPADYWRKTISVGSMYQATIPKMESYDTAGLPYPEDKDVCLWHPSKIPVEETIQYLQEILQVSAEIALSGASTSAAPAESTASSSSVVSNTVDEAGSPQPFPTAPLLTFGAGTHVKDDELALFILNRKSYDREAALASYRKCSLGEETLGDGDENSCKSLTKNSVPWSEAECRAFEEGLRLYGKHFYLIQKNKLPSRTVMDLVQFYYLWKKTERHDVFANKNRLEKKKYALHPGITDYMDKFIEDHEEQLYQMQNQANVSIAQSHHQRHQLYHSQNISLPNNTLSHSAAPCPSSSSQVPELLSPPVLKSASTMNSLLYGAGGHSDLVNTFAVNSGFMATGGGLDPIPINSVLLDSSSGPDGPFISPEAVEALRAAVPQIIENISHSLNKDAIDDLVQIAREVADAGSEIKRDATSTELPSRDPVTDDSPTTDTSPSNLPGPSLFPTPNPSRKEHSSPSLVTNQRSESLTKTRPRPEDSYEDGDSASPGKKLKTRHSVEPRDTSSLPRGRNTSPPASTPTEPRRLHHRHHHHHHRDRPRLRDRVTQPPSSPERRLSAIDKGTDAVCDVDAPSSTKLESNSSRRSPVGEDSETTLAAKTADDLATSSERLSGNSPSNAAGVSRTGESPQRKTSQTIHDLCAFEKTTTTKRSASAQEHPPSGSNDIDSINSLGINT